MRTQRKAIAQIPDAMLDLHQQRFPEAFERNAVIAMFALRALAQRINDCTNESLAPLGLSAAKYNYLVVLYLHDGGTPTLSEISELIHTSNATVTSMIAALERDGLLRRSENPSDRRSVVVKLTAKGRKRVEAAVPVHRQDIESALSDLSLAEREQLSGLLLKVSAGFDR